MFSAYLEGKRQKLKKLVEILGKDYKYASVLATDVKSLRYMANRAAAQVTDGQDCERGFVVKLSNGGAFSEYSFDVLPDDLNAFASEIKSSLAPVRGLTAPEVKTAPVDETELKEDFLRNSDLEKYSAGELLSFAGKIKDGVLSADENIVNAVCLITTYEVSKMFISAKRELTQNYAWVNGIMVAFYQGEERLAEAREVAYADNLSDVLEKMPGLVEKLAKKAANLSKAKPITPGVFDVITDPSISGLIAHEAFGHGVEMDQFVKDRAVAKEYVGKYVASPIVSMRDGAGSALSAASYFFDDDGVLAHDTQIIKDGILVSGLCDLVSSRQLGVEPTGNGRRQSFKNKAYTRMTNTFFEAGKDKLEDMIKSVKHGYMLFETNNGMEDPKNWAIQCVCEYGVEIVDGKLTDTYVSPVVMSGYVPDLLKSISMISDGLEVIGAGMCGKGYKEWVRVSDGGPALKARVKLS